MSEKKDPSIFKMLSIDIGMHASTNDYFRKKDIRRICIELILMYIDGLFNVRHNVNTYVHRQLIHGIDEI